MALWQSIPFVSILLPLGSAAMTSALKGKMARRWTCLVLMLLTILSVVFLVQMSGFEGSYTYRMGHYDAPWGNEIRASFIEAITAHFFLLVMLLSFLGGWHKQDEDILPDRLNLYCVLVLLMTAALMAEVYTNDMFSGYVFVEIMTIAAAALIASRSRGRTLVAATRYLIMNMVGSGLFLLGIILLYDMTGHLLMKDIHDTLALQAANATLSPMLLTLVIALITVGLCIKSALFPFHTWVPDAYSYGTPTSSAILSSLVSKAYIFLLIKIYSRVIGFDLIISTNANDLLFVFAVTGMIMGSVYAIRQTELRCMIALSSVAQIGYIYMGIGMGTQAGLTAALFHVFSHALCKSMLFIASSGLIDRSGGGKKFRELRGAGYRAPIAGVAFTIGALSMVGFPFLAGFTAKLNFAFAAMEYGWGIRMVLTLAALAISTWLNTLYFLRTVITLYRKPAEDAISTTHSAVSGRTPRLYAVALMLFMVLLIALGMLSATIVETIASSWPTFG